jgi:psiF repeat-containing protein
MTRISAFATATAVASLLLMGAASAQTAAPKTDAPKADTKAPAAKAEKAPVVHSAASLECSKEADAKGLHGKDRKKFRSECKATAAKGDKPAK